MCLDVYLLLPSNVICYVSCLGLEHQVDLLTHVFVCQFIPNHNQRNVH